MSDPDLIARLYVEKGRRVNHAARAITVTHNPSRYLPPRLTPGDTLAPEPPEYDRGARQPTEPPQEERDGMEHEPCLELRFSHGPRTGRGFVFGTNPATCDVVLPRMPGVSEHHCALTFEDDFADGTVYRPVVRDLGSTGGTAVNYDEEGGEVRRDFRWIVGSHQAAAAHKVIVLRIVPQLKFHLVVMPVSGHSATYTEKIDRLLRGAVGPENLFDALEFQSRLPTEFPSGALTPGTGPILVKIRKLGQGTFGVVHHWWDVSSGAEYAIKEPENGASTAGRVSTKDWENEGGILEGLSHAHIVRILYMQKTPRPQLRLEYVPGGSLDEHMGKPLSPRELVTVLDQCLSALVYLHGLQPPILHRDIKPRNILVQYRNSDSIHVKLADFCLSRECEDPRTWCGTPAYVAPEMHEVRYNAGKRPYGPAVDIWSLGVVMFELCGGSLRSHKQDVHWCRELVARVETEVRANADKLKQFLLDYMLVMNPDERYSAEDCYNESIFLSDYGQARAQTPTPASYAGGSGHGITAVGPVHPSAPPPARLMAAPLESGNNQAGPRLPRNQVLPPSNGPRRSDAGEEHPTREWTGPSPNSSSTVKSRPNKHPEHSNATPRPQGFPAPVSGHEESTFRDGYYHGNWLRDPLAVGSTVANMGRENERSSRATQTPRSVAAAPPLGYGQGDEESEVHSVNYWPQQPGPSKFRDGQLPAAQGHNSHQGSHRGFPDDLRHTTRGSRGFRAPQRPAPYDLPPTARGSGVDRSGHYGAWVRQVPDEDDVFMAARLQSAIERRREH